MGCASSGSGNGNTGGVVGSGGSGGGAGGSTGGDLGSNGGSTGGSAGGHAGSSGAGGHAATGGASGGASGAGGHAAVGGTSGAGGTPDGGAPPGWLLTWSDEFDGADGSAVDPSKWIHDVGGAGWGNNELEYYTDGTQNAVVQGGNLVITATTVGAASHQCSYPTSGPCQYTSARLLTKGKFSQKYGRFEARIQLPAGQGLWPAFWLLGTNIDTVNWPSCGEVDIMENIGKEPSINHGSLHMPAAGTTNDSQLTGSYTLPGGAKLSDAFHTYAIEWSATAIKFYLDDMLYETQTPQTATGRTWEFDQPFFIILNVAVGGQWPGSPDSTTTFPQTMKVDWVRVYQPSS
jgi:beta-glucanase (GH16 family)